jgi:hypothetical protein
MEAVELLNKLWPIFLGFLGLVGFLVRNDVRVKDLEAKVETLFELHNRGK